MHKYELMYIITPTLSEDEIKIARNLIENNFQSIDKVDDQGIKDLAYEIERNKRGYYVIVEGTIDKKGIDEILHIMKINKNYLRHLLINLTKEKGAKNVK